MNDPIGVINKFIEEHEDSITEYIFVKVITIALAGIQAEIIAQEKGLAARSNILQETLENIAEAVE